MSSPNSAPSSVSLLQISGPDAATLLQGQLTNDVTTLRDQWQFSGLCNPKGRLLTVMRMWRADNIFLALLPADHAAMVAQRLRMYVLRSKVEIELITQPEVMFSLDPNSESNAEGQTKVATQGSEHTLFGEGHTLRLNCAATDGSQQLEGWMKRQIELGQPWISAACSELFVPQMVNLDLLGGISFKKGCYTGQEIVARMHYLGKLKQRMFVCETFGDASVKVAPGSKVFSDPERTQSAGTVVACESGLLLAVLRFASSDDNLYCEGDVSLKKISPQPYIIEPTA